MKSITHTIRCNCIYCINVKLSVYGQGVFYWDRTQDHSYLRLITAQLVRSFVLTNGINRTCCSEDAKLLFPQV